MSSSSPGFQFSSASGKDIVRRIITESKLRYSPHDYQVDGVCKLLDGLDLIAVLPTGAGKTGYYTMYTLMLLALRQDSSLRHLRPDTPEDPCVVMVYPTNGLEEEQAAVFEKAGICPLVINAESLARAREAGKDLWREAKSGVSIVLLSPEQLVSPGFESLLQAPAFQKRVCALGIDEVHLLNSWGLCFRKSFRQIGLTRARMPSQTRLVGTTATLLAGRPQNDVLAVLGLDSREFHMIRRSNLRHNVRTIFRTLTHGLGGWVFPDLRWVLPGMRKTVIHCRTISLSFRVALYLLDLCPPDTNCSKRVRMYNALNWPDYNTETRRLMLEDPEAQIIIATSAFMVGIDLPNIADIIILGPLRSADEHVQWEGRAGRDPRVVSDARCLTLLPKSAYKTAQAICAGKAVKKTGGKKSTGPEMEVSMARLLCADCISAEQDRLYDNPPTDPLCSCPTCSLRHNASAPVDLTPRCNCSGKACMPEDMEPAASLRRRPDTNPIPRKLRVTKIMRSEGMKELHVWRRMTYHSMDTALSRSVPAEFFLPDWLIKSIFDQFALIDSEENLRRLVAREREALIPHVHSLWVKLEELAQVFDRMRKEKEAEKKQLDLGIGKGAHLQPVGESDEVTPPHVNAAVFNTFRVEMGPASQQGTDTCPALFEWNFNVPSSCTRSSLAIPVARNPVTGDKRDSSAVSGGDNRPRTRQRTTAEGKENIGSL